MATWTILSDPRFALRRVGETVEVWSASGPIMEGRYAGDDALASAMADLPRYAAELDACDEMTVWDDAGHPWAILRTYADIAVIYDAETGQEVTAISGPHATDRARLRAMMFQDLTS